jgi:hypothetical protein
LFEALGETSNEKADLVLLCVVVDDIAGSGYLGQIGRGEGEMDKGMGE